MLQMERQYKNSSLMVIYNFTPDLKEIVKSLQENTLDFAIFIDNSTISNEPPTPVKRVMSLFSNRVIYRKNYGNIGLSKGLNIGIMIAKELNCQLLYLLDQDAILVDNYFSIMNNYYENIFYTDPYLGAFGAIVSNKLEDLGNSLFSTKICEVQNLINSGIAIPLRTYERVGSYNENFFLGSIDTEFAERMKSDNLSIYRINIILIKQDFGITMVPNNFVTNIISKFTKYHSLILLALGKTNEFRHNIVSYTDKQIKLNYSDEKIYNGQFLTRKFKGKIEFLIVKILELIIEKIGSDNN